MRNTTARQLPEFSALAASDGPRAFSFREACDRLDIGLVKGHELTNSGELETYTIGRRRYVTQEALQSFVKKRLAESLKERHEDRAKKVEKAVAGRARRRDAQVAA